MVYHTRLLEAKLKETARFFKVVLIVGARQVGKSTLLNHVYPDLKNFVFDPLSDIYGARNDPDLFLDNFEAPIILDEIQYVPELLPAIKRRVDLHDRPGQYFLTSSQNLSVLKNVAESMAGRVGILQLEGMTIHEVSNTKDTTCWLSAYLKDSDSFHRHIEHRYFQKRRLTEFIWRGSMPGLLGKPNSIIPTFFHSYIQTYIDRDIRLMENIKDLALFHRFISLCAALTSQEINSSQLGREIGISPVTARKWLDLLLHSYQWLEINPYFGNTIKRISGKKKGYFRDSGLACNLQRISSPDALAVNPNLGAFFETMVVNHIYKTSLTLPMSPMLYHWRTSGGAEVDLILESDGKLYPIEIKCKTKIGKNDTRGLRAFRDTYPHKDIETALIIYAGKEIFKIEENTVVIPWNTM